MSPSVLSLPAVPAELKSISAYVQRAEELKSQDKIVSYWCAYYAAQVGISLKSRDAASRDYLFALLGSLEHLKAEIGPNDAIDIESVSSAYVENFALKVFANADNEDRSGRATRSTAKKFLAAANFLEVLKTFPKSDVSESNEDKIRYSKWKAADIAKAFREGRKPVPGPPGWAEEQEELKRLQQEQNELQIPSVPTSAPGAPSNLTLTSPSRSTGGSPPRSSHFPSSPPRRSPISSSPPKHSPTSSSPPMVDRFGGERQPQGWSNSADSFPENWSNAATPGTEGAPYNASVYSFGTATPSTAAAGQDWTHGSSPVYPAYDRLSDQRNIDVSKHIRNGSGSSHHTVEGKSASPSKSSFKSASPPDSDKKVRFSDSVSGSPPPSPTKQLHSGSAKEYQGPSSIYAPPPQPISSQPISPPTAVYPSVPPGCSPPTLPPSTLPPGSYIYAPPASSQPCPPRASGRYPPPPPPQAEIELTPELIALTQKHCRFAISALDYEDVEQAKKDLRAALALLGG